jgi:chromosomal replication initiation ATPase DnaA
LTKVDRPFLDFPLEEARPKLLAAVPSGLTLQLVEPTLPDIPKRCYDSDVVLRCVAESYSITVSILTGPDKHRRIAEARMAAYWLLKTLCELSYPETGRVLHKDQSCARNGFRGCEARRAQEPTFLRFTDELAAAVKARLEAAE